MKKFLISFFFAVVFASTTFSTFASGVDLLLNYGSRYVGMGGNHVSLTGDAYPIFYNPAAMTGTPGTALAVNSTTLLYQYGAPFGTVQRKSELGIAPLFFFGGTHQLNKYIFVGLGMFPTALQGAKFKHVTVAADQTDKNVGIRLARIEVAPTVALKFNDYVSAGLSWRPAWNKYEKYAAVANTVSTYTKVSGFDWDGMKVGAYVNNLDGFSAGLTFRPENEIELTGQTDVDYAAVTSATDLSGVSSYQSFRIPAQLQMGVSYEWLPNRFTTALCYEQTYSESIDYDRTDVGGVVTAVPLHLKTGHSIHLGAEYVFLLGFDKKLKSQLGFTYDSASNRHSNQIAGFSPAGEYYGGSMGSQYEFNKSQSVGLALNYGGIESESSATELDTDPSYAGRAFAGKYTLEVFTASIDYQFKF